jgi:DNA ligase-1
MTRIKPLLALKCPRLMSQDEFINKAISYPCFGTPKIDFIRIYTTASINQRCNAYTRSRKFIPNTHIRNTIENECPPYLDGELGVGKTFQDGTSGIMSYEGKPEFTYYVFDCRINEPWTYEARVNCLQDKYLPPYCKKLIPRLIHDKEQLLHFKHYCLEELQAEGICVRPLTSLYNTGYTDNRSTFEKPFLVAICDWEYSEARVVGFNELYKNLNEGETNAVGRSIRPKLQEGMLPAGTLGSLQLIDIHDNREFDCGSGIDDKLKREIWMNRDKWSKKIVRYKYKKYGTLNKPRTPVYDGVRDERDMS